MHATLPKPPVTAPDKALVSPPMKMAKADLDDNRALVQLSGVVKEAAKQVHGKQGAAAAVLHKDEGNFARDVVAGRITLKDCASLGPKFLAELGKELVDEFGPLTDPRDYALRSLDSIEKEVKELRQFVLLGRTA